MLTNLDLTKLFETKLTEILENSIAEDRLDKNTVRMIIARLTPDGGNIEISWRDEHKKYISSDHFDGKVIGHLDANEWLRLGSQDIDKIEDGIIDKAKEYLLKYFYFHENYNEDVTGDELFKIGQVLEFDFEHIIDEKLRAYHIVLLCEMYEQFTQAMINVATKLEENYFNYLVSFVTIGFVYNPERQNSHTHAISHPKGEGPFFSGMLNASSVDVTLTYPKVKFTDDEIILFYLTGNHLNDKEYDDEPESSVYFLNKDTMEFFFYYPKEDAYSDEEIKFHYKGENGSWNLEFSSRNGGNSPSQEEFSDKLRNFKSKTTVKKYNTSIVPNPDESQDEFKKWLDFLIDNNLQFTSEQKEAFSKFDHPTCKKAFESMPSSYQERYNLWANYGSKKVLSHEFETALEVYNAINFERINGCNVRFHSEKILTSYLYLNDFEGFENFYNTLDEKYKKDVRFPYFQYLVLTANTDEKKKEVESILQEETKSSHSDFALALLYCLEGDIKKAVESFSKLDKYYKEKEQYTSLVFKDFPQIAESLKAKKQKEEELKKIEEKMEKRIIFDNDSIFEIPHNEHIEAPEYQYHQKFKLEVDSIEWVHMISEKEFYAVTKEFLFKFEIQEDIVKEVLKFEISKFKNYNKLHYYNNHFYYIDEKDGIQQYVIEDNELNFNKTFNTNEIKTKYSGLSISNNYIYTSNNNFLQILDFNSGENILKEEIYLNYKNSNVWDINFCEDYLLVSTSNGTFCIFMKTPEKPVIKYFLKGISNDYHPIKIWDKTYILKRHIFEFNGSDKPKYLGSIKDCPKYCVNQNAGQDSSYLNTQVNSKMIYTEIAKSNDQLFTKDTLQTMEKHENGDFSLDMYEPDLIAFIDDSQIVVNWEYIVLAEKTKVEVPKVEVFCLNEHLEKILKEAINSFKEKYPEDKIGGIAMYSYHDMWEIQVKVFSACPIGSNVFNLGPHQEIPEGFNMERVVVVPHKLDMDLNGKKLIFNANSVYENVLNEVNEGFSGKLFLFSEEGLETRTFEGGWEPVLINYTDEKIPTTLIDILESTNQKFIDGFINEVNEGNEEKLSELLEIIPKNLRAYKNVFSKLSDKDLILKVTLNGLNYGHRVLEYNESLEPKSPDTASIDILAKKRFYLDKPEVKQAILDRAKDMSPMDGISFCMMYKEYTHPSLNSLIINALEKDLLSPWDLPYYGFFSAPDEFFNHHKEVFSSFYEEYMTEGRHKNSFGGLTYLMFRSGKKISLNHPFFEKNERDKKDYEQNLFPGMFDDDLEIPFHIQFERLVKSQYMMNHLLNKDSAIYLSTWKPEPFTKSWHNLIERVLRMVKESDKIDLFFSRLCGNIGSGEEYKFDEKLGFEVINYFFKNVEKYRNLTPQFMSIAKAFNEKQGSLSDEYKIKEILEKYMFTKLQDAWNKVQDENHEDALEICNELIELDPSFSQAYFLEARLLWLMGGVDAYLEKEKDFVDKAGDDPATLGRLFNLAGCAYDLKNNLVESLSQFEKASQVAPKDAMYVGNIAEVYHKMGNSEQAILFAKKAKSMDCTNPIIDTILGNKKAG